MQKELIINGLKYVLKEDNEPIYEHKGLMWTKTFSNMNWEEAIEFCKNLTYGGYSNWRLPSRFELESLLNLERCNPACDILDTVSDYYWSSTTYAVNTVGAWSVNFDSGDVYNDYRSYSYYVRAVRGGQC